jgi:predicted acetylornithine/succinylornithine family transaminase
MTRQTQQMLIEAAQRHLTPNYNQQPIVLTRGEGVWVWDDAGNRYLDMTAGIAVCLLGHGHAGLQRAIAEQAGRLIHVSNLFYNEPNVRLSEELTRRVPGLPRIFYCNSGAEANETAFKLARRYAVTVKNQPDRTDVVAMEGSFHGRTFAAVSLTGQEKYRKGFGPLLQGVSFVRYGDLDAAARAITDKTCAVYVEPIQGEGGVVVAPPGFLSGLRDICRARGALLVMDEVQTGMGRTGVLFAHQREKVVPDIMTTAKGLAGGVPMGAMMCSEEVAQGFAPGAHASTFGGNPLASAAALAVLRAIDEERLLERADRVGQHLAEGLAQLVKKYPARAKEVRGVGLLRGVLVEGTAAPLVTACRERGLLLSAAGGSVVRFAPPLTASEADCDQALEILSAVLAS